jgi:hypothetical protein
VAVHETWKTCLNVPHDLLIWSLHSWPTPSDFLVLNVCTCVLLPAWTCCSADCRQGPEEEKVVPVLLLPLLINGTNKE